MKNKGFTLVELTIVVAIIAIILTIAIPMYKRSKLAASESSAIATLRTIHISQEQVLLQKRFLHGVSNLPLYATFAQLATLNPPVMDTGITLAPHIKSGYLFSIHLDNQTDTSADFFAIAVGNDFQGNARSFYIDVEGVIRYTNDGSVPTAISSPIQ